MIVNIYHGNKLLVSKNFSLRDSLPMSKKRIKESITMADSAFNWGVSLGVHLDVAQLLNTLKREDVSSGQSGIHVFMGDDYRESAALNLNS